MFIIIVYFSILEPETKLKWHCLVQDGSDTAGNPCYPLDQWCNIRLGSIKPSTTRNYMCNKFTETFMSINVRFWLYFVLLTSRPLDREQEWKKLSVTITVSPLVAKVRKCDHHHLVATALTFIKSVTMERWKMRFHYERLIFI